MPSSNLEPNSTRRHDGVCPYWVGHIPLCICRHGSRIMNAACPQEMPTSSFYLGNSVGLCGVVSRGRSSSLVLKMAWGQELTPGLRLLTSVTVHLFQFRFAVTEKYWHPSWLFTLTFFRSVSTLLWQRNTCTWRWPWRPARTFGACGSYAFHATGNLDSPHRVFEFCIPVEVSMDFVVSFSSSSGSEAVSSLFAVPGDGSGILSVISHCPVWF